MRNNELSLQKNIWWPVYALEVVRFWVGGGIERPPVTILKCVYMRILDFLYRILKNQKAVITFASIFSISCLTSRIQLP